MSYIRIYPTKSNTIFKNNDGPVVLTNGGVNTGQNTIMELQASNGYSVILNAFDLTSITEKLNNHSFTCNLRLFDAGTIFEPPMPSGKKIDLLYFTEEFTEGDGFAFVQGLAVEGFSNWNFRNEVDDWTGILNTGDLNVYTLNNKNEDLTFDVKTWIDSALIAELNPNFGVRINEDFHTPGGTTETKFIYSRHTRTIFTPYLEFVINDEVIDDRSSIVATKTNRLHLLNQSGENFVGAVMEINCTDAAGNSSLGSFSQITNPSPGVYYVDCEFLMEEVGKVYFDSWSIDGEVIAKNLFKVQSPNQVYIDKTIDNHFFYASTSYVHPVIYKGDFIKFNVISEQRGKGSIVHKNFEYKVVTTSKFDMTPWMPVSLYNGSIFFNVDTSFFFEGLEYVVLLREVVNNQIKTSGHTYKFRLLSAEESFLRGRNSSPYNSRDWQFKQ